MCKEQIKAFCESHCWFHFYMMWYSVFAQAVLTDRMEYCILTLNNWSFPTLVDYSFGLDLFLKRESLSDELATCALHMWFENISCETAETAMQQNGQLIDPVHCPVLQLSPVYLLSADSQGGPLWVMGNVVGSWSEPAVPDARTPSQNLKEHCLG